MFFFNQNQFAAFVSEHFINFISLTMSAKQKLTGDDGLFFDCLLVCGLIGVFWRADISPQEQAASPAGHMTRAAATSSRQRFVKNKQTEGRSPGGAALS